MCTCYMLSDGMYHMEPFCRYSLWRQRMWMRCFGKTGDWKYKINSILNTEHRISCLRAVLSRTTSKTLITCGPPEAVDATKFCLLIDPFLILWTYVIFSNMSLKKFHVTFTSVNDRWFVWLQKGFLKYFEDCLAPIEQRLRFC